MIQSKLVKSSVLLTQLFEEQKESIEYFFTHIDVGRVEEVVEELFHCSGTLVFSGMGKSGKIAKKIVATLSSINCKASYLCPVNAFHGDIGILSERDLLVLLSKSGESKELHHLALSAKEREVRVIVWGSNPSSTLAKSASLYLDLPLKRELCPFNLIPTTSSILQLIVGDILTVAFMRKKGVEMEDYLLNHPGGSIGKRMMLRVQDLMLQGEDLPLCSVEDTLAKALIEFGCVLAIDQNQELQGIFTDGDLRRVIQSELASPLQKKMKEIMTKNYFSVERQCRAIEALDLMQSHPHRWVKELPVVEGKKIVGLIRMHDLVRAGI